MYNLKVKICTLCQMFFRASAREKGTLSRYSRNSTVLFAKIYCSHILCEKSTSFRDARQCCCSLMFPSPFPGRGGVGVGVGNKSRIRAATLDGSPTNCLLRRIRLKQLFSSHSTGPWYALHMYLINCACDARPQHLKYSP